MTTLEHTHPKDPPIRTNGGCAKCGQPRHPERSRRYAKHAADLDPFCSNICAREWWNNPMPTSSIWNLTPRSGRPNQYE